MSNSVPFFEVSEKCQTWHNTKHLSDQPYTPYLNGLLDENGKRDMVAAGQVRQILPAMYGVVRDKIKNMEIRPDDIWTFGPPRNGTHLVGEMVWLINNNLDFEAAKVRCTERNAFFDNVVLPSLGGFKARSAARANEGYYDPYNLESLLNRPSPRHYKSHLMFELMPDNLLDTAKIFYVCREVKDAIVSYYHFEKDMGVTSESVDFKTFCNSFIEGQEVFGPYFTHVKQAWARRHHPNLMFMFYEDILKDMPGTLREICKFLDKHYTDEQLEALRQHLAFDNMKNNASFTLQDKSFVKNGKTIFTRKGQTRQWREYFDEELLKKTNAWIERNLADSDFKYPE